MILISVIIPVYNTEKFVHLAVQSILNQSINDFELLICDDGSTDKSLEIIKSFKDERISIYENKINRGNLETTNFLLQKCKGEFIVLQDSDDYSFPLRFEILLNMFDKNQKLGLVGSFYNIIDEDGNEVLCGTLPLDNETIKKEMEKDVIPILYPSIMVKNEIAKKAGLFQPFFNRKGYADFDWMARCSEFSDVQNSNQVLYAYRKHSESFTFQDNLKVEKSLIIKNMHILLVNAHNSRLNNLEDFFKTNNTSKMYRIISNFYIKRAENLFWENKNLPALVLLGIAIKISPLNFSIYKTLFYILRKIISLRKMTNKFFFNKNKGIRLL